MVFLQSESIMMTYSDECPLTTCKFIQHEISPGCLCLKGEVEDRVKVDLLAEKKTWGASLPVRSNHRLPFFLFFFCPAVHRFS
jgi:hypothetical protein